MVGSVDLRSRKKKADKNANHRIAENFPSFWFGVFALSALVFHCLRGSFQEEEEEEEEGKSSGGTLASPKEVRPRPFSSSEQVKINKRHNITKHKGREKEKQRGESPLLLLPLLPNSLKEDTTTDNNIASIDELLLRICTTTAHNKQQSAAALSQRLEERKGLPAVYTGTALSPGRVSIARMPVSAMKLGGGGGWRPNLPMAAAADQGWE